MSVLKHRLRRLERAVNPPLILYLWPGAGETVAEAIARRWPDGVPENATVIAYRWANAAEEASTP